MEDKKLHTVKNWVLGLIFLWGVIDILRRVINLL